MTNKGIKTGFSLIELLVYMGCSLILSGYITDMVHLFQSLLTQKASKIEGYIDFAVAFDRLMGDLGSLSSSQTLWKEHSRTSLVFTTGSHDTGWVFSKQRLIRITGKFCSSTQRWKKRATTVVLSFVTGFDCKAYYAKGFITAFHCTLSYQQHTLSSFVSLQSL